MIKRLAAECLGTFWLVLGGCGSAVLAANFGGDGNPLGIGLLGVSLAFGLTVVTMAYAVGHISGGHFNPAVSIGLWAGGRFPAKDLIPYIVAQVLGGLAAGAVLYCIASGQAGFAINPDAAGAFATNGYGTHSPGGYSLQAAAASEISARSVMRGAGRRRGFRQEAGGGRVRQAPHRWGLVRPREGQPRAVRVRPPNALRTHRRA